MSFHPRFDTPKPDEQIDTAPVVLRFASMFPRDLKRRAMHDRRTGGDLGHVRKDLSHLNSRAVGDPDWIAQLLSQVERAAVHNHAKEIGARQRKGRHKEARQLRERGPVDPWKYTRGGPLREGILTVNKQWFGGPGQEDWDPERVAAFQQRALDFLREHFPDEQLREASVHEDEEAFHIHFTVAVWVEKDSENRGRQRLLQPSANPLLANYEHAQDVAGEAFLDLGIHRGERRAQAAREAKAAGLEGPDARAHVPPSRWRADQRRKSLQDADRIKRTAADRAETITSNASDVARSTIKKTRKRAIRDAQACRAEAEQAVADARITRQRGRLAAAFLRSWTALLENRAHERHRDLDRVTARLRDRTAEVSRAEKRAEELQHAIAAAGRQGAQEVAKAQEDARRVRHKAAVRASEVVADAEAVRSDAKQKADQSKRAAEAREAKATDWIEAVGAGLTALSDEVAAASTRCPDDEGVCPDTLDKLRPVYPQIAPAAKAADDVIRVMRQRRLEAAAMADTTARVYREAQEKITKANLKLEQDRKAVRDQWSVVTELRGRLEALMARIRKWLTQPALPSGLIGEADEILRKVDRTCPQAQDDGPGM